MKLLAQSCNRWNFFFPLSLFGDKVNGFLKGSVDRAAELAGLVPSSWLLLKLWNRAAWSGMEAEGLSTFSLPRKDRNWPQISALKPMKWENNRAPTELLENKAEFQCAY